MLRVLPRGTFFLIWGFRVPFLTEMQMLLKRKNHFVVFLFLIKAFNFAKTMFITAHLVKIIALIMPESHPYTLRMYAVFQVCGARKDRADIYTVEKQVWQHK